MAGITVHHHHAWGDVEAWDDSEPPTPISVTQSIDMLLDTIFEDPYEGLHADDMQGGALFVKHTRASTVVATVLVSHAANMLLHARRGHTTRISRSGRSTSTLVLHWTVALFGCAAAALCTLCAVDVLVGNGLLPGLVQDILYGHASEQPAAATMVNGQHPLDRRYIQRDGGHDTAALYNATTGGVGAVPPHHDPHHGHARVNLPDWALSRQLWILIIMASTILPMTTPRLNHTCTSSSAISTAHHLTTTASTALLAALGVLTLSSWCVQGGLAPLCLLPGCGLAPRPWTILPPWADTALQAAALACVVLGGLLQAHMAHLAALQLPHTHKGWGRSSGVLGSTGGGLGSAGGTAGGTAGGSAGSGGAQVATHVPHPASWGVVGGWAVGACVAGVGGYCVFGLWVAEDVLVSFNLEDLIPLAGPHWLALGLSVTVKTLVLCSLLTTCPTWFTLARHHLLRAACGRGVDGYGLRGSYQSLAGGPLEGAPWDVEGPPAGGGACGGLGVGLLHVGLVGVWWGIAAGGQMLQVVAGLVGGVLGGPLLLMVPAGIAWRSGGWWCRLVAVVLGVLGVLAMVLSVAAVVLT